MRTYTAIIEQCPDTGLYVGYAPGFPGAHSQAETLDALHLNLEEVIEMLLQDGEPPLDARYVGTQTVTVSIPNEPTMAAMATANNPATLER
jgi:predicted RNase H-like HicB family nuclease